MSGYIRLCEEVEGFEEGLGELANEGQGESMKLDLKDRSHALSEHGMEER